MIKVGIDVGLFKFMTQTEGKVYTVTELAETSAIELRLMRMFWVHKSCEYESQI